MGRRRLTRFTPMTTWRVSAGLNEQIIKHKKKTETVDIFITKIFHQWSEWKDTISFLEDAYHRQSVMIENYVNEIQALKLRTGPEPISLT